MDKFGESPYCDITSVLIFILVFLVVYLGVKKPKGIPPGPTLTLPLFGDLPLLLGGDIVKTFRKLRKRHGDIFSFYMGKELLIVLNGYETIYKAAVVKGHFFSARPSNYISNVGVSIGKGIIFANGPFWKSQRRFVNFHLQNLGFGKGSFEDKILNEVKSYLEVLSATNGEPYDITAVTQACVANVVFAIVCGKRHEYNDPLFKTLLESNDKGAKRVIKLSVVNNCFPFMKYLPGDLLELQDQLEDIALFEKFVTGLYDYHKETFDSSGVRDIIDAYINEMRKADESGEDSDFTFEQLNRVVSDLFRAGSETTATALRWAVLALLNFPDLQLRLQKDIDNIIKKDRMPCLDDKTKLPCVEAFVMETLRFANIAPLSVPHCTLENNVTFEGYAIPKNTGILFNLDSVFQDPDVFENPTSFNPERFLDASGNVLKPKEFIPFGVGRRVCLGENVARMELFLFLTAMIKEFEFHPAEAGKIPALEGIVAITHSPKPYKVRIFKRSY